MGVYKEETTSGPYVDQVPFPEQMDNLTEKAKRDLYASSWNLSTITLPSQGTIEVDYEMDDYLWVQDKKAMQMHEIIGMAPTTVATASGVETSGKIKDRYRIFFKLNLDDYTQLDDEYMASLVEDIDMLYFRTWMKYKVKNHTIMLRDMHLLVMVMGLLITKEKRSGILILNLQKYIQTRMKGRKS